MDVLSIIADPAAKGAVIGALALILLGAAWHKLSEPNMFLSALAAYRLLPQGLLDVAARGIPLLEIALGAGLLVPATRSLALVGVALLMLGYALAIGINLARGRSYIDCGCGGAAHPLSWGLVVRNGVLAAAALAASGATMDRPLDWLDAVTVVLGVLAFFVTYLMADELLRQASRMARAERSTDTARSLSS
ncbi:MAG: methylamine utilization protein MauE [Burkholderiales bacterium]|nr:methylamine utilization protein MauE [Burkholderiales bacterium]